MKNAIKQGRAQLLRKGDGLLISTAGDASAHLDAREMEKVFNGDEVKVRIEQNTKRGIRGKPRGAIIEVLKRNTLELVGVCKKIKGAKYIVPENTRLHHLIRLPEAESAQIEPGQFARVAIVDQPDRGSLPSGAIIKILGNSTGPDFATEIAIAEYMLRSEWSEAVLAEADKLKGVNQSEIDKRTDLRGLPFVTIDGQDAKDFDDAVCARPKNDGWTLWVAIADVSHYVRPGLALDEEARLRGCSSYFPQCVLPMLPERLSNDLCSLTPNQDKFCLVCEIDIGRDGKRTNYRFSEAVIHSQARLTYDQVSAHFEHGAKTPADEQLSTLFELYKVLRRARKKRASLEFSSRNEVKIEFDKRGQISGLRQERTNDAHRLIEECMLAANICAAHFLETHRLPLLFRVHDRPKAEKLQELRAMLDSLGLKLGGGQATTTADFNRMLDKAESAGARYMAEILCLRSMAQAVYQTDNIGHFGLNYPAYTHFTSPIRRYPDLLIHRAIRCAQRAHQQQNRSLKAFYPYSHDQIQALGVACSQSERRAEAATRKANKRMQCAFLATLVGSRHQGMIVSVTTFGAFIELDKLGVQGLLPLRRLRDDYYRYNAEKNCLQGQRRGRKLVLGQNVQVKISQVDESEQHVDLELA